MVRLRSFMVKMEPEIAQGYVSVCIVGGWAVPYSCLIRLGQEGGVGFWCIIHVFGFGSGLGSGPYFCYFSVHRHLCLFYIYLRCSGVNVQLCLGLLARVWMGQ